MSKALHGVLIPLKLISYSRTRRYGKVLEQATLANGHIDSAQVVKGMEKLNISNEEGIVQEIHDNVQAYYKVAMKRFVDNVCMQAAAHHLITRKDGPLNLFTPSFVNNEFDDAALEDIAGEDAFTKQRRKELITKIADLEQGSKLLV